MLRADGIYNLGLKVHGALGPGVVLWLAVPTVGFRVKYSNLPANGLEHILKQLIVGIGIRDG